jgi:hypothetical protein
VVNQRGDCCNDSRPGPSGRIEHPPKVQEWRRGLIGPEQEQMAILEGSRAEIPILKLEEKAAA